MREFLGSQHFLYQRNLDRSFLCRKAPPAAFWKPGIVVIVLWVREIISFSSVSLVKMWKVNGRREYSGIFSKRIMVSYLKCRYDTSAQGGFCGLQKSAAHPSETDVLPAVII